MCAQDALQLSEEQQEALLSQLQKYQVRVSQLRHVLENGFTSVQVHNALFQSQTFQDSYLVLFWFVLFRSVLYVLFCIYVCDFLGGGGRVPNAVIHPE